MDVSYAGSRSSLYFCIRSSMCPCHLNLVKAISINLVGEESLAPPKVSSPIKDWVPCWNLRVDHCARKIIWIVLASFSNGQVTLRMVDLFETVAKSVFRSSHLFYKSLHSSPLLIYPGSQLRRQSTVVSPGRRTRQIFSTFFSTKTCRRDQSHCQSIQLCNQAQDSL